MLNVLRPLSWVIIDGVQLAVITRVQIYPSDSVMYGVEWWDRGNLCSDSVDQSRVALDDGCSVAIGFK